MVFCEAPLWGFECFKIGVNGDTFLHDAWISTTELQYFDPNAYVPVTQSKQWLAPLSWNQGGYDAVCVEFIDNGTGVLSVRVRFVQVTRANKHSFEPKFVAYFLQKMLTSYDRISLRRWRCISSFRYENYPHLNPMLMNGKFGKKS